MSYERASLTDTTFYPVIRITIGKTKSDMVYRVWAKKNDENGMEKTLHLSKECVKDQQEAIEIMIRQAVKETLEALK